jgi:sterol desaturase/sphingolipid hydroxylase (fatty acid hydroxylase superfamily)
LILKRWRKAVTSAVGTGMFERVVEILRECGDGILNMLPLSIAIGIGFAILSALFACNRGAPWWRKRELATDLCYWFLIPLLMRYLRIGLLVVGATVLFGISNPADVAKFYENGHGPLATLPLWLQATFYMVVSDFLLYWNHRAFHGNKLWKYHAVHHSSEDLDWISAARFHPANLFLGTVAVDVTLLLVGISPDVMIMLSTFTVVYSAFVHANLNWTLGPFRYVLATPVFHRWHHTAADRGGSKNFSSTFPSWDLLFGTFYMPRHQLPDAYGVAEALPTSFAAQILYPFRG